MNPNDRVLIDLPYDRFENAVLTALERDTGRVPIMIEIMRLCRNAKRKIATREQQIKNLRGGK
jgi:hypothetical protein